MPSTNSGPPNRFGDAPPRALGAFNPGFERAEDVKKNGWAVEALRMAFKYLSGSVPGLKIFEEAEKDVHTLRIRRRPCDKYTLRSKEAKNFERKQPNYFPYPYRYPLRGLQPDECFENIFQLALEEFVHLDYLFPLASVIQAIRPETEIPFISRCWGFDNHPNALIKSSELSFRGGSLHRFRGACICFEPPVYQTLAGEPTDYLIFRNVVGHEIGHYWWKTFKDKHPPSLQEYTEGADIEQIASLFSLFLIMSRGYWERKPLGREDLEAAFAKLRFETKWAARKENAIIEKVHAAQILKKAFVPKDATLSSFEPPSGKSLVLGDEAVMALRDEAQRVATLARHIPLASAAQIINCRKLDHFITFVSVENDEMPDWIATDRVARHLDLNVSDSTWREYQFHVPEFGNDELPPGIFLQVARHLAHIRLFGDWFGSGDSFTRAGDVERECDAEGRDLGRIIALVLYAFEGKRKRRKFSLDLAKTLLKLDPSGLKELVPYAENYFQWCCQDESCPKADDRFRAEIQYKSAFDVHFQFWGENGEKMKSYMPITAFLQNGFNPKELRARKEFKLFLIDGESGRTLIPAPLRPSE